MIEVERKFFITPAAEAYLAKNAQALPGKTFTDTYYDLSDFSLSLSNRWLRLRSDRYELKMSVSGQSTSSYRELETEEEIRAELGLAGTGIMADDLAAAGYGEVARFTTERRRYRVGEIGIDLDVTDFGYAFGELEVMVADGASVDAALAKIEAFAAEAGIEFTQASGKLTEFAYRRNRPLYDTLSAAGIMRGVIQQGG